MPYPAEQELLAAACHVGHPREKWNPKMAPYLYGTRKGIHIIDLTKTAAHLQTMCEELKGLQAAGKTILFVSTKQQSIPLVEKIGQRLSQPVVTKKWIPGLLTNWATLKKRLQYYKDLRHGFATGEVEKYTKKEQTQMRKKLAKLDMALAGVGDMAGPPDAMFIVDAVRDNVAVKEARKISIPVYGICDSNADPDDFAAFVPCNDDATKSVEIVLTTVENMLADARPAKQDDAA
ncbi:MAG: small subunit ribosomal protein S2 [Candidatus Peregrinibacteria bacterium Gr01-1014_25]|nr:MAG: small subunit ribosomal protein S2 [Candidatus Peregrinibacteria bacterium Gr01-1014_25]